MSIQEFSLCLLLAVSAVHGDEASPWRPLDSLPKQDIAKVEFGKDQAHADGLSAFFALGLPDPKGLSYHRFSVPVWNRNGEAVEIETEGWLLPKADQDPQRYALVWNGLIYPLTNPGEPVELIPRESMDEGPGGMRHAHHEATDILPHHRSFIRYAYLSRLGFEKEAKRVADDRSFQHHQDFLKAAADEWAWNTCARAIEAFKHGDDERAYASVRQFLAIQSRLPEAKRYHPNKQQDWLGGLARQAESLESESKRRLGRVIQSEEAFLAREPGVEALINRLDEIRFVQFHQESVHPVIDALIAKGDEAIEPLIRCLENDQRLTRYVLAWRNWAPHRSIYTVRQAAYYALGRLMKDKTLQRAQVGGQGMDDAEFKKLADKVRAQWKKHGPVNGLGRSLSILKDHKASPAQWADAAETLVDSKCLEGDLLFVEAEELPNPGRSLSEDQQHEVTPVITKRIGQLIEAANDEQQRFVGAHPLKSLHLSLWTWDRKEGENALQKLVPNKGEPLTKAMDRDDALEQLIFRLENLSPTSVILLEHGMRAKRPEDYVSDHADHFPLRTILRNGGLPAYVDLFKKQQSDPESSWNLTATSQKSLPLLVATGMRANGMKHDFFQEALLSALEDRTTGFVTMKRLEDEPDMVVIGNDKGRRCRISPDEAVGIAPGQSTKLRRADLVAKSMDGEMRPPLGFELYWPQDRRDEAIDEMALRVLKNMAP